MVDPVLLASGWITGSGIQHKGSDPSLRGGVSAWYEIDEKIYPFLYSEITGYALTTFLFLHRIYGQGKFLKSAQDASNWLIQNALHADGGVKTRFYLVKHYVSPNYCFHHGRIYSFDTAMVGYGLLQYFKVSKEEKTLRAVEKILDFLTTRMRKKDGAFYPYFDSKTKKCGEDLEKWSDHGGAFHGKLALLFVDTYRLLKIPDHRKIAAKLLEGCLSAQKADGRFITGKKDQSTHLHPHAYTLEGLLYAGIHLKRNDFIEGAFKGFLWMLHGVSLDGSVSSIYVKDSFSHHERSDIVAQTLRIGSILYAVWPKRMRSHLGILSTIKRHLLLFQHSGGKREGGGFVYGSATDGLMRMHLNAWSTMFALQALWMYENWVSRRKKMSLECLI